MTGDRIKTPVYLDHHATTPVDPRVLEVMDPAQREHFGNPASSYHAFGWAASALVEKARAQVASLVGADPREIVFTSGATEADNLAVMGVASAYRQKGRHIVCSAFEHEAVLGAVAELERRGWRVTRVVPDAGGLVGPEDVAAVLEEDTVLVAVMAAQNEIGTIQPFREIGHLCRERGIVYFCDAAQAAGYVPLDVKSDHVSLLALSGHKIYGPKGVGALFVSRRDPRVRLMPRTFGGGQEGGLRSGTLNVAGIVGLGEACALVAAERERESRRMGMLRDRLWHQLKEALPGVHLNGARQPRLPHNLNVSFDGLLAHQLLGKLTRLAVSSSSACASGSTEPSAVLLGLGIPPERARSSLRISCGRFTTEAEIDFAAQAIIEVVTGLRRDNRLT